MRYDTAYHMGYHGSSTLHLCRMRNEHELTQLGPFDETKCFVWRDFCAMMPNAVKENARVDQLAVKEDLITTQKEVDALKAKARVEADCQGGAPFYQEGATCS